MPRPKHCRKINYSPDFYIFKPAGITGKDLELVELHLDEFEALRLADFIGLYQDECAMTMGVSRQTFGNILTSAHRKVINALINGKKILIKGGHISITDERVFACINCNHKWQMPFGTGRPNQCPKCLSSSIQRETSASDCQCRIKRGCKCKGTVDTKIIDDNENTREEIK